MTRGPVANDLADQKAVIDVTSWRVRELMEMVVVTLNADHPSQERDDEIRRLLLRSAEHLNEMHRACGRMQAIERFAAGPPHAPLRAA